MFASPGRGVLIYTSRQLGKCLDHLPITGARGNLPKPCAHASAVSAGGLHMRVVRAVAQGEGNFQQLPIFNSSWFGTWVVKT
jgi:hypothetical protein